MDRIDDNGHYEPGNVRWALAVTQANNRRPRRGKGVYFNKERKTWYAQVKHVYVGTFATEQEALAARATAVQQTA